MFSVQDVLARAAVNTATRSDVTRTSICTYTAGGQCMQNDGMRTLVCYFNTPSANVRHSQI
jgi:hypothetical protein